MYPVAGFVVSECFNVGRSWVPRLPPAAQPLSGAGETARHPRLEARGSTAELGDTDLASLSPWVITLDPPVQTDSNPRPTKGFKLFLRCSGPGG